MNNRDNPRNLGWGYRTMRNSGAVTLKLVWLPNKKILQVEL